MNTEFYLLSSITRALPSFPGLGRLSGLVAKFYARKTREEVETTVNGSRMVLRPRECVDRNLLFSPQTYERPGISALRSRLQPQDVFLDAGANIGFFTLSLAPLVAQVLAVEADPKTVARLIRHVQMNRHSHVAVANVGLADNRCILRLGQTTTDNSGGNSLLQNNEQGLEVQCLPLLEVLEQHKINRLDAAKFDIEGFEFRVLRQFFLNAPEHLVPRTIVFEENPIYSTVSLGNTVELLKSNGYRVRHLKDCDYLATRGN